LHEDDQGQQNANDHQNREKYRDENRQPHKGGNMCRRGAGVKLRLAWPECNGVSACTSTESLYQIRCS
jgi:hypothetical protein